MLRHTAHLGLELPDPDADLDLELLLLRDDAQLWLCCGCAVPVLRPLRCPLPEQVRTWKISRCQAGVSARGWRGDPSTLFIYLIPRRRPRSR